MSDKNKKTNMIKRFFASIGIAFLAMLNIGATKKLNEGQSIRAKDGEEKTVMNNDNENNINSTEELFEISRKGVTIDFNALNKEKMGEYTRLYCKSFMDRYPEFSELVNSDDPSIENEDVAKDLYGFVKAYYIDQCGKKLPFFNEECDLDQFNRRVEIITYQNWSRPGGDGLYVDGERIKKFENDKYLELTNQYVEMTESKQWWEMNHFSKAVFYTLAGDYGLVQGLASQEISDGAKDELIAQNDRQRFITSIITENSNSQDKEIIGKEEYEFKDEETR